MFRYNRKRGFLIPLSGFGSLVFLIPPLGGIQKNNVKKDMEEKKTTGKNKGGRPKAIDKKDQLLGVKCSHSERKLIEENAALANLSVSEYLRQMGLTGKIDRREKALPPEVLQLSGTLNHTAANLNQIAKKRNGIEPLNAIERAELQTLSGQVKQLVWSIKNYLQ